MTAPMDYQALAREIQRNLDANFDPEAMWSAAVLNLAEETGEFVGAYRRWAGLARRTGTHHEMATELADVVIVAHTAAEYLGIDLPAAARAKAEKIRTRGWKDAR